MFSSKISSLFSLIFYENDEKLKKEKEDELKNVNSIRKILIDLLYDLYKIRNEKIKANDLVKEIYKSFDKKIIKSGFNHYQENFSSKTKYLSSKIIAPLIFLFSI